MKIKGSIHIGRPSYGDGRKRISIEITDEASRIQFVDLEMTYEDFVVAVTNGTGAFEAEVRGLEYVGKQRVQEKRTIEYTGEHTYKRSEMEKWLGENGKEEGWLLNTYLGSQTSSFAKEGKTFLNYSVHKFVETPTPAKEER